MGHTGLDLGQGDKGQKQKCASNRHTDGIYTSEGDGGEMIEENVNSGSVQCSSKTHTWSTTHTQSNGPEL